MSISDFNPAIIILLAVIALVALGMFIGSLRRSSASRYDVRREDER